MKEKKNYIIQIQSPDKKKEIVYSFEFTEDSDRRAKHYATTYAGEQWKGYSRSNPTWSRFWKGSKWISISNVEWHKQSITGAYIGYWLILKRLPN